MNIFAISDLHLSAGVPGKSMSAFGRYWNDHERKIEQRSKEGVGDKDILLIAGDISWAMKLDNARPDIEYIAGLPGRKVLVRGNHDYWWSSVAKVRSALPDNVFALHHDALFIDGVAIAGTRLWEDIRMPGLGLPQREDLDLPPASRAKGEKPPVMQDPERDEKIFTRELNRLKMALADMNSRAELRIAMVHFPPISIDFEETRASRLMEEAGIHHCVFGHLHKAVPSPGCSFLGVRKGVSYHLASCDYLDFIPSLIARIPHEKE